MNDSMGEYIILGMLFFWLFFLGTGVSGSGWVGISFVALPIITGFAGIAFTTDWKKRRAMKRNKPAAEARRRKKYAAYYRNDRIN